MVCIETKKDLALVRRAITEGWNYDRNEVVSALLVAVGSGDPGLVIEASKVLLLGDTVAARQAEVEIKREALELEKRKYDDKLRIRLIELAISSGNILETGVAAIESAPELED